MVINALAPMQYVTGADILNQGDLRAQLYNNIGLNTADVTGYFQGNPTLAREQFGLASQLGLGGLEVQRGQLALQGELGRGELALGRDQLGLDRELGFGNLALGRDQLNAAIAEAQRQFQLDTQRFGLEVANFNYNQRLGEATVRLEQLGLLSSLRGPADYLAYNYTLNNMAAPEGTAVDPFQMTAGLNQQYTAPPMSPVAQPAPTTQYNAAAKANPSAPTGGGGGGGGGAATRAPTNAIAPQQQQRYQPPPSQSGIAISGNQAADQALAASSSWAGAPPAIAAEFARISQNMNNTYNNAMAQNPNFQLFAEGGKSPGGMAIVGDHPSGVPTGNEEMVISEGPFQVLDHEDTMETGALGQGAQMQGPMQGPDDDSIAQMIIEAFMLGQQQAGMPQSMPAPEMPAPEVPRAAWGGSFGGSGRGGGRGQAGRWPEQGQTPAQPQQPQRPRGRAGTGPGYDATQEWSNPYPQAQQRQRGRAGTGPGYEAVQEWTAPSAQQAAPVGAPGTPTAATPQRQRGRAGTGPGYDATQEWPAPYAQQAVPNWAPPGGGIAGFGPWLQAQLGQMRQQVPHAATGGSFGSLGSFTDWQAQQGGSFADWQAQQGGGGGSGVVTGQPVTPPGQVNNGAGFFNFNTHGPQDTANAPFMQQALGNMENPGWMQRGAPLGPFGAQPFNYGNYLGMLPSAREMMRGYIETPPAMGGLGGDWMDELERSRRASATGVSLGPAQYQR